MIPVLIVVGILIAICIGAIIIYRFYERKKMRRQINFQHLNDGNFIDSDLENDGDTTLTPTDAPIYPRRM